MSLGDAAPQLYAKETGCPAAELYQRLRWARLRLPETELENGGEDCPPPRGAAGNCRRRMRQGRLRDSKS